MTTEVRNIALGLAVVLAMFFWSLSTCSANAESPQASEGHMRWHHYYQHWKQPGTTVSCCNARVNVMGVEMGDCEPTRAEIRQGDWYAWERLTQRWLKIPDDRILRERNPSVEEGHLCFNKWTGQILCFVPPDTGG